MLDWIRAYVAKHGYAPTHQEIADGMEVSKTAVVAHIANLIRGGALERRKGVRARAIALPGAESIGLDDAVRVAGGACGVCAKKIVRQLRKLPRRG